MSQPCGEGNTKNSENVSGEGSPKGVNNDHRSPDRCVRDRVLKEVGLTSTAFIGPAFPPESSRAKSDIEDTLSEFYKELEEIDTPHDTNDGNGKQDGQLVTPPESPANTNIYHKNSRHAQSSWPHWYRNEPYHLKRPGVNSSSSVSDQNPRHYPPGKRQQQPPRFHRPRLPHQTHHSELSASQTVPTSTSLTSETTNHYQNEFCFSSFSSSSPSNIRTDPSQGFYPNLPHHFSRDEQVWSCDTYSDDAADGWSGDRKQGYWFDEDYDRPQGIKSESDHWEQTRHYQPPSNTMILMRGLPGSGKTTLARELLSTGPSGVILSTDDYFAHNDGYRYDPDLLGLAHEWNQSRAEEALHDGRSPIIIDNTNLQAWEMKPYVRMALERGYKVDFCEPDTIWKFDPFELERRNKHNVPQEKIAQMLDRFSFPISIDIVMSSQEPPHVMQRCCPEQLQMRRRRDFL